MNKQEIIRKIIEKKEFSNLPKKDVELAFSKFEKREVSDGEKIRLTRKLLHEVFGAFLSGKLFGKKIKDREPEFVLRKHMSARERLPYYNKIYGKIVEFVEEKEISVIDLGAGINGFSFLNFPAKLNYIGVEAVGQLVDLMNYYFKKEKLKGKAFHVSLFETEKIKRIISKTSKPRVVFIFKALDSLEMLEKDYSKKLLLDLKKKVDLFVVSFATKSMVSRRRFNVDRKWIITFINREFNILNEFEVGGEKYIIFTKR